jgi:hypothetical protein
VFHYKIFHESKHTRPTHMITFKKVDRFDLEIHKVGHQECLIINGMSPTTEKIINHKYTTHMSNLKFKFRRIGSTIRNLTIEA